MLQKGEISYNSKSRIKHGLKSNNLVRQINMQRRLQQQLKFNKTVGQTQAAILKGVSLSPKTKKMSPRRYNYNNDVAGLNRRGQQQFFCIQQNDFNSGNMLPFSTSNINQDLNPIILNNSLQQQTLEQNHRNSPQRESELGTERINELTEIGK